MKFAFVITDLSGGGAEKGILKLAELLARQKHNVHLILLRRKLQYQPSDSVQLTVISDNPSLGWVGKRCLAYRLSKVIKRLEAAGDFDLIVSTLPLSDEIALLARLPNHFCCIVNTLSAEIEHLAHSNPRKSRRRLKKYQTHYNGRKLIAVSRGVKHDLIEKIGLNSSDITVIYLPFDVEYIQELSQAQVEVPHTPYIIHVGRFSSQKRHDILLDAFEKVRHPCHLVLLTESDQKLDQMILERGLQEKVIVANFQKNPYPWIAHAQLLVLSSDHEGMPNVLIESLIVGTPVVSTDCPSGPREILGDYFPECLVPIGDSTALAEAIDSAMDVRIDLAGFDLSIYQAKNSADAYELLATGAK